MFHNAQYLLKIRFGVRKFWSVHTIRMKNKNIQTGSCADIQTSISLLLTTVAVIGLFLNTDLFAEGSTVNFFGSLIILHLSSIGHQPYRVAFEYKRHVYSSRKSQSPSQSLPIKQSEKGPAMSSLVSYLIYVHRSTNNSVLFNFRIISS